MGSQSMSGMLCDTAGNSPRSVLASSSAHQVKNVWIAMETITLEVYVSQILNGLMLEYINQAWVDVIDILIV
jgi:hypothetical protein